MAFEKDCEMILETLRHFLFPDTQKEIYKI